MSHPHTQSPHSSSGDDNQLPNSTHTRSSLGQLHTEILAVPRSPQATSGSDNLESITIDVPEAGSTISTTPINEKLSTSIPTSGPLHRQHSLLSGPKSPNIVNEDKALPITQATLSLPGQSAPDRDVESRQLNMKLDDASGFWEGFNKVADFDDREFVKTLSGNLDSLLTFAGLFSGVVTTFIIESIKTIQPDQAQKTNDLIRSVLIVLQNTTTEHTLHDEPFIPTPRNVRCTIVFFTSLCCSLSAAFGAVLGKQWLNQYEREGVLKPPPGRGRERQKKYEGRSYWHMEGIIETLPTILQISLFLFLIALVDFMFPVNIKVAYVVMGFSLAPALLYVVTTIIATLHPLSPFQTRLSGTIRSTQRSPEYLWKTLIDMFKHPFLDLVETTRWPLSKYKPPIRQLGYPLAIIILLLMFVLCFLWRVIILLPGGLWSFIVEGTTLPDAILDLKCLIFYAERTSSSDALTHITEAIGTLPPDLGVGKTHPIVDSFCGVLFKFVIKPASSVTSEVEYISKLTNTDFRHLLKALRFLYTTWLDTGTGNSEEDTQMNLYLQRNAGLIANEAYKVFSQEPENINTASLVADILQATSAVSYPIEINPALVWDHLKSESLGDADSLPYIGILSASSINQQHLSSPIESEVLVRRLRSTMWINGQPDLNYTRSRIRAQILSECLGETTDDLRFSLYLVKCLENSLALRNQENVAVPIMVQYWDTCNNYLAAIFSLLHRDKTTLWLQQFEIDGIPSLLMQALQPDQISVTRGRALLCFVSLWHCCRSGDIPRVTPDGAVQLYLAPHAVESVVFALKVADNVNFMGEPYHQMMSSQVALGLQLVVEYFEAASLLGLLRLGMESIGNDFRKAAAEYPQSTKELQEQLQERMDKLVFS